MFPIDLRSDTVTKPTPEMRTAMAGADVGDDVFGEDPTVNRLEAKAAELMGKDAGLFVPSGTMGNLVAVLTHCGRGDEAIMGNLGHTFLFEQGGVSALGGVVIHTIPNQGDGTLKLGDVRAAIRPNDIHAPVTRLVILENTHNRCGGVAITGEYTHELGVLAHERGLLLHLDGARIFNAAAALGVSAASLAAPVDSVTFCLSKGLCAPVGSVLCGSQEFISRARRFRKQLGGGMRQAGIIAAAGLVALETMTTRLVDDHRRARRLAEALNQLQGCSTNYGSYSTNMVFLRLSDDLSMDGEEMERLLAKQGVLAHAVGERTLRLVVHYWISDEAIDRVIAIIAGLI